MTGRHRRAPAAPWNDVTRHRRPVVNAPWAAALLAVLAWVAVLAFLLLRSY